MTHLRAFIAAEFSEQVQNTIHGQIAALQKNLGDDLIRWVPARNIHLTLKFLGDIAASHVDFIKQALMRLADLHSPFEIQIGGFGSFPRPSMPRVLWLGIHAPAELARLQRNVEAEAARLGYEKEARAFSPHLTLGRVRQSVAPVELKSIGAKLERIQLGNIAAARIDSIQLFKSDLRKEGAVYEKIFSIPLKSKEVNPESN